MDTRYVPNDDNALGVLGRTVEELGELQHALGKAIRFGFHNYKPGTMKRNGDEVLSELRDVRHSLQQLERLLTRNGYAAM